MNFYDYLFFSLICGAAILTAVFILLSRSITVKETLRIRERLIAELITTLNTIIQKKNTEVLERRRRELKIRAQQQKEAERTIETTLQQLQQQETAVAEVAEYLEQNTTTLADLIEILEQSFNETRISKEEISRTLKKIEQEQKKNSSVS